MLSTIPNRISKSPVELLSLLCLRRAGAPERRRSPMPTFLKLTLATLLLLTSLSSAQMQQHPPFRVNIPFDFIAGTSSLPAGDYTLSTFMDGMEVISGQKNIVVTMAPAMLEGKPGNKALLIFHQLGDKYFLAEVWPAGSSRGRVIGGSETLKRRMDTSVTSQVTVIAGQRNRSTPKAPSSQGYT